MKSWKQTFVFFVFLMLSGAGDSVAAHGTGRHHADPMRVLSASGYPSERKTTTKTVPTGTNLSANHLDFSTIGSESPVAHTPDLPPETSPKHPRSASTRLPGEKTLFFTSDDGPLAGTANLLNVLKEEGIKATMFYIGRNIVKSPDLFHRALAMPNLLVANHTYTHANNHYQRFYRRSAQRVVDDIDRAQKIIGGAKYLRLCGRNVWRLPHIYRNDWAIRPAEKSREVAKYDALANRGYFIYGWDIEWLFNHTTQRPLFSGTEMARRVRLLYRSGRTAQKGKIILLVHDFMWQSAANVRQLRTFIHIMKAEGWTFDTIDAYCSTTPAVYEQTHKPATAVTPSLPPEKEAESNQTTPALSSRSIKKHFAHAAGSARKNVSPNKTARSLSPADLAMQLSNAIRKQQFLRIRKLLARGARINGRDPTGEIPLNLAIKTNNAVLVRMLVEQGADIFRTDAYGMSPMGIARELRNTIIIHYLIRQITHKRNRHKLPRKSFFDGSIG